MLQYFLFVLVGVLLPISSMAEFNFVEPTVEVEGSQSTVDSDWIRDVVEDRANDLDGDFIPNSEDRCPRIWSPGTNGGCPDCSSVQGSPGDIERALGSDNNTENGSGHQGIDFIFDAASYRELTQNFCKKIWDLGNQNHSTRSEATTMVSRGAELIIRLNFGMIEGLELFSLGDRREEALNYVSTLLNPTRIHDLEIRTRASRILTAAQNHRWEPLHKFYLNVAHSSPNRWLVPSRPIPMEITLSTENGDVTTVNCPNSQLTGNTCTIPVATNTTIEIEFAPSEDPFLRGWRDFRACGPPSNVPHYCRIDYGNPVFNGDRHSDWNRYLNTFSSSPRAVWWDANVPQFSFVSPTTGFFHWSNDEFLFPVDARRIYKGSGSNPELIHEVAGNATRTPTANAVSGQYYQHAVKQVNGTTYYSGLTPYPYVNVDLPAIAPNAPNAEGEGEGNLDGVGNGEGEHPMEPGEL